MSSEVDKLLCAAVCDPDIAITDNSRLRQDLSLDELALVELKESLECALGCKVAISKIQTVGDLRRACESKKSALAAAAATTKPAAKHVAVAEDKGSNVAKQSDADKNKASGDFKKVLIQYGFCAS